MLDEAVKRRAKELLILTGERPEVNSEVASRLAEWGHPDFTSYVIWTCERALERGLLPHTNIGVVSPEDIARLRKVTASQGLMLESVSERLMETVHAGSPTKHPDVRLAVIEEAGRQKVPFTSGILVGIGESVPERTASLEALARVHERHGHIQEVIIQNFVPHPNYYGREPAEIAARESDRRWGAGGSSGLARPGGDESRIALPGWACPVSPEDLIALVAQTAELLPEVGIQVPPNLSEWWPELVEAGATDLGGLSANGGPHLARAPVS